MNRLYLVLDLSSALYVGLVAEARTLAARIRPQGTRGENAHALVDECLSETGAGPGDLAGICVGIGPGSFTGIRVCGAMAQGLAFAKRLPLYPFSSLAALETASPAGFEPVAAIAANAGRYYARHRGSETMLATEALAALGSPSACLVVSGNVPDKDRLAGVFARIAALEDGVDFARLAALALAGVPVTDGVLRPNYLAASAAEEKLRAGLLGKPGTRP